MAEKKNPCGCGCALKQAAPKASDDKEKAKDTKESK